MYLKTIKKTLHWKHFNNKTMYSRAISYQAVVMSNCNALRLSYGFVQ